MHRTADPKVWTEVPVSLAGPQALLPTEEAADTMESHSIPTRRGRVLWQGLLLAGKKGTTPGNKWEDGSQDWQRSLGENSALRGGEKLLFWN